MTVWKNFTAQLRLAHSSCWTVLGLRFSEDAAAVPSLGKETQKSVADEVLRAITLYMFDA